MPETTTCQQHVESTGATETNTTVAAYGLQHDAAAMMQQKMMQPPMMQMQQQPQMGMNMMKMPHMQYGAPQQQQQWKMM